MSERRPHGPGAGRASAPTGLFLSVVPPHSLPPGVSGAAAGVSPARAHPSGEIRAANSLGETHRERGRDWDCRCRPRPPSAPAGGAPCARGEHPGRLCVPARRPQRCGPGCSALLQGKYRATGEGAAAVSPFNVKYLTWRLQSPGIVGWKRPLEVSSPKAPSERDLRTAV